MIESSRVGFRKTADIFWRFVTLRRTGERCINVFPSLELGILREPLITGYPTPVYTRNLVDEGNGRFNLMVLCWGEGHGSAIHDHANAHCVMKILQGELCETRYAWPEDQKNEDPIEDQEVLKELQRCTIGLNDICYINDSLGLHRVENPSAVNPAVSLHLYSPPFSSCSTFNKQTGQRTSCKVTFWSKFGERRNREVQEARRPEDN